MLFVLAYEANVVALTNGVDKLQKQGYNMADVEFNSRFIEMWEIKLARCI